MNQKKKRDKKRDKCKSLKYNDKKINVLIVNF